MKIGVISDTHMQSPSAELIEVSNIHFRDVDLILHAGDLVALEVLKAFSGKKVIAVRGNMDLPDVARKLTIKEVVEVGGCRIGLIHGWGSPRGLEEKIRKEFDRVSAIVYGHTHRAANQVYEGVLFFNPGAFKTDRSFHGNRSVGILTIDRTITGEIVAV
jgi:hypothetical protein